MILGFWNQACNACHIKKSPLVWYPLISLLNPHIKYHMLENECHSRASFKSEVNSKMV